MVMVWASSDSVARFGKNADPLRSERSRRFLVFSLHRRVSRSRANPNASSNMSVIPRVSIESARLKKFLQLKRKKIAMDNIFK